MKHELDLLRDSVPVDADARTEPTRKDLREATDELIHSGLLVNDLPELVRLSAETMCTVATALLRFEREPAVPDLVEAAQALIEQGRAVMDKGLLLRSWETVQCGAVMLELTVRGICAALSVPYDRVLTEVVQARAQGRNSAVRQILIDAGLVAEPIDPMLLCPLIFKGPVCGSQGGETACDKTLRCCTSLGNQEHYQGGELR